MAYRRYKMELLPGDRVVITEDAFSHETSVWVNRDVLDATRGSIGRVLSYNEYRELYAKHRDMMIMECYARDDPEYVESKKKKGTHCAIQYEAVAPTGIKADRTRCAVGRVIVLDDRFYQKLNQD